jgi:hypothetical protein
MGRNCGALCRCVNCFNHIHNTNDNNNNNQEFRLSDKNDYLTNEHNCSQNITSINLHKQNMNNNDNNLIKDGFHKEQYEMSSNTNLIQHVNRNIQRDDIRNKTRKICLLFKTDCIRIEITKKGMKIEKKNLPLLRF